MTLTIIITSKGKKAQRRSPAAFENEDKLQQFIHGNPGCIPMYEIDEDKELHIIAREFKVSSGRVDAIGVDQHGEIYIIETKLDKNSDKRKILAQVLDYGASMVNDYTDFNKFAEEFKNQLDNDVINEITNRFTESYDLVENFKKNISEGKFKFIILMDKLDDGLKILIKFINQHSDFKIYAVELRQYKYEELRITIPKLFGAEIGPINNSKRGKWNKEKFFDHATKTLSNNQEQLKAIKILYEFAEGKNNIIQFGTGVRKGSFNVVFKEIHQRSVYSVWSNGMLTFQFAWLDTEKSEEYRKKLQVKLSKIKGLKFPQDDKNVDIKIEKWVDKVDEIRKCLESVPRS